MIQQILHSILQFAIEYACEKSSSFFFVIHFLPKKWGQGYRFFLSTSHGCIPCQCLDSTVPRPFLLSPKEYNLQAKNTKQASKLRDGQVHFVLHLGKCEKHHLHPKPKSSLNITSHYTANNQQQQHPSFRRQAQIGQKQPTATKAS